MKATTPAAWLELLEPREPRPATKLQRQCLYKLLYPRALVKALSSAEASKLIQLTIDVKQRGPV